MDRNRLGFQIAEEAFRAFDLWRADHDPDGEMSLLDAAVAYAEYGEKHSLQRYFDAARTS